jgi:hypothetical protein
LARLSLTEKLRELEQCSCQAGFYGQKAGGGESLVGLPQARCQHGYEITYAPGEDRLADVSFRGKS